jgi:hypothetical protein
LEGEDMVLADKTTLSDSMREFLAEQITELLNEEEEEEFPRRNLFEIPTTKSAF